MKQGLLLFVLLVLLLPVCLAGAAVDPTITAQAQTQPILTKEYLIGIPAPREPLDLSPDLRNASSSRILREVAGQVAGPLLTELKRLQSRGEILAYKLDPAQFAVKVTVADELPLLIESASYVVNAEDGSPSCAAGLPEAVATAVQAAAAAEVLAGALARSPSDEPTINVRINAPYLGEFSYVFGETEPNVDVKMRVYRNGSLYIEWYDGSYSDGSYQMYPYWEDCPRSGYSWYLQPGDVVEVEAAGKISRTTVVPLVASLDPMAGQITGQTAPNREIRGWLGFRIGASCNWDAEAFYNESGPDGRFTEDVGWINELDRSSDATIYVVDNKGHITLTGINAFSINTETNYNGIWIYVNRGASGVARVSRGGQQIASMPFVADATGYASVYFDNVDLLPGDVITVQDGRITITTTIASADFTLDAAQNRLAGTTTAGYQVMADFYTRDNPYDAVQTGCEWNGNCGAATAPAGGAISIPAGFDLQPGDYSYSTIYDPDGNRQYVPTMSAPTLAAGPGLSTVRGYWARQYTDLDVRLFAPDNSLKTQATDVSSYDGEIYTWLGVNIAAGDRIEVTDGIRMLSMVVPEAGGRLNSLSGALEIRGPNRPYLANFFDQAGPYYNGNQCFEGAINGGQTIIDLNGWVSAQDYADVYIRGTDNNYVVMPFNAFTVYVTQESPFVDMYAETPGSLVTLTIKRSNNVVYSGQLVTDSLGYTGFDSLMTLTAYDQVIVTVNDGTSANFTLTPLSAQVDPANNEVFGIGPANREFLARLTRITPYSRWSWSTWTQTSQDARYWAMFYPDWYWGGGWRQPCLSVRVDDRCVSPGVQYWTDAGHSVNLAYDIPPTAAADPFESDNTAATAKPHPGGTRSHTFHTETDVDWVKVTIPPWVVSRPVTFRAFNMGWGVSVDMALYRQDGTTLVPDQSFYYTDNEVLGSWTPDAAGTVLLRIAPFDEYAAGHCDSFYDLRMDMAQLSLPMIMGK